MNCEGCSLLSARFRILLICCFWAGLADASWTGVAMQISNYDSNWKFAGDTREAQISTIDFQIEEKASTGLRVGANIGYMDLRLVADSAAATRKFDGEYISVYLRQPFRISDGISLHSGLSLRYSSGSESGEESDNGIDWIETVFELGLGLRLSMLRIMPFAAYHDIDGDISDDAGTSVFELDEQLSRGIRFDYFVEDSAFVRLEVVSGAQAGGYLVFARRL